MPAGAKLAPAASRLLFRRPSSFSPCGIHSRARADPRSLNALYATLPYPIGLSGWPTTAVATPASGSPRKLVQSGGEATAGGEVRNHELVQGVAIHHAVQERRPLGAGADDARDAPAVLELEREALEALGAVDRVEEPCEADGLRVAPAPQLFVRAWTRAVLSLSTAIDSHS